MNVLWLSHLVPYPPKGGVLQRSYNLLREVSRYHQVTLIGFVQSDLISAMYSDLDVGMHDAVKHLRKFCDDIKFIEIPCEERIHGKKILASKSLFTATPYTINWLKSDRMHAVLRDVKKIKSFDVIHYDTISLSPYLAEFPLSPKVLDHHNIESHMMARRAQHENNIIKKTYFYLESKKLLKYEKAVCNNYDRHITCSELDSDRLKDVDPSLTIDVIPNGVDTNYFSPKLDCCEPGTLIFAGGLSWYPNRDAMLYFARDIWPSLKVHLRGVVMNVVGKSPPSELVKLATIDDNYRVHGFVDDVREYIGRSEIYVCPIRDGGGTKLKILDACAMGKAIVAHPNSCEGLDMKDNVDVMLASTPEEFVEKIVYLHNNKDIRIGLGNNARKLVVDKYSFTGIGKKLSDIYSSIG